MRRTTLERKDINPWEWSKAFGFSQAVELTSADRVLMCSGQTAMTGNGTPMTTADMSEQVRHSMTNLTAVLDEAGMTAADIVKLTVYTTDADELIGAFGSTAEFLGDNLPAMSLIVVSRLAFPELKVEIEATAAR
jgi:enamine deaminase RidA (YjgF/YER057c/UK114 family)